MKEMIFDHDHDHDRNNIDEMRKQMMKERASGTLKKTIERMELSKQRGITDDENSGDNNSMRNNRGSGGADEEEKYQEGEEEIGSLARPRIISKTLEETLIKDVKEREIKRRFKKCSVVGNDSSMRNAKLGEEIELSEAVYRMNFAPLKSFEVDVGKKTHTMCMNPEKMRRGLKKSLSEKEKKLGNRDDSSLSSLSSITEDSNSNNSNNNNDSGRWITDNGNIPERVLVVGDVPGKDAKTGDSEKPCIERSQGGLCIERTRDQKIRNMKPSVQKLAEELLYTLQGGVGEENGVPTTGLYCLILALTECESVDVYGIGVGTMNKEDLKDLEYFKDDHFRGWDARHNAEAERTLLRVLASKVWENPLMAPFGDLKWHNPLMSSELVNANLLSQTECISGIRCVK